MLQTREIAYSQKLPQIRARMATFDTETMQARYDELADRTRAARETRDAVAVAPLVEQRQWAALEALEDNAAFDSPAAADARSKHRIIKGRLFWEMEREYRVRMWRQERELDALAAEMQLTEAAFGSVRSARDSIPGTVADFSARIDRLAPALDSLQRQLQEALRRHADHLTGIAVAQLRDQRERLLTYRAQARFALATIYDRLSASNTPKPAAVDEAARP
jgi:chromosome segregation ATPase